MFCEPPCAVIHYHCFDVHLGAHTACLRTCCHHSLLFSSPSFDFPLHFSFTIFYASSVLHIHVVNLRVIDSEKALREEPDILSHEELVEVVALISSSYHSYLVNATSQDDALTNLPTVLLDLVLQSLPPVESFASPRSQ